MTAPVAEELLARCMVKGEKVIISSIGIFPLSEGQEIK